MTDPEMNELLVKRFLRTQTFYGRTCLKVSAQWKQLSWRAVVSFAFFLNHQRRRIWYFRQSLPEL